MKMRLSQIIYVVTALLLTWIGASEGSHRCPLGFQLAFTTSETPICYRLKQPEAFSDKFNDCTGNLYSSKLYHSLNFTKTKQVLWTEYKSLYPGGPFIDWSYTDYTGDLLLTTYDVKYDASLGLDEELCVLIDPVSNFTAARCNEKHYRYCFVKPYPDEDDMSTKGCKKGAWRFNSPLATCLTAVTGVGGGTVRATWRQAQELCAKRRASLLYKGWRYSNSPMLHTSGALPYYPLGLQMSSDHSFLRYDTENDTSEVPPTEWNFDDVSRLYPDATLGAIRNDFWSLVNHSFIFYDVICEQPVDLKYLDMRLALDRDHGIIMKVNGMIKKSQIRCFTDSVIYYPTEVSISKMDDDHDYTFRVIPASNGYYWCIQMDQNNYHVSESNRALYIRSKDSVWGLYACKIRLKREYRLQNLDKLSRVWKKKLEEYIYYRTKYVEIYGELPTNNTESVLREFSRSRPELSWTDRDVIYNMKIRRLYVDARTALLHVMLNPLMKPPQPGFWDMLEVVFMRPAYYCEGFDSVPSIGIGDSVTSAGCRTYTCVGDYDEGVQWVETETTGCTIRPPTSTVIDVNVATPTVATSMNKQRYGLPEVIPDEDSSSDETTQPVNKTRPPPPPTTEIEWTFTTVNNMHETTVEVTTAQMTTEVPTTTEIPTTTVQLPLDEQLQQVVDELEQLLEGQAITIDRIDHAFDQVNAVLDVEDPDLEIPGQLLHLLDQLASEIQLEEGQQAITVRDNVAMLMAEATPERPVRGLRVLASDYDVFTNDSFGFIDSQLDSDQLLRNSSDAVLHLPASVSSSPRRVSFVAFRNQRAFRSQELVNSRIFSVNVENLTHFEDGEDVKGSNKEDLLRPRIANILFKCDEKFMDVRFEDKLFNIECLHNTSGIKLRSYNQGVKDDYYEYWTTTISQPWNFMYMNLGTINVYDVLDELDVLLQNESISLTCVHMEHVMDQVDTLLEEEIHVEIPGELLKNLDRLGNRVKLEKETGRLVRNNFAVLVADASMAPGASIRGIRLASGNDKGFTDDRFQFINDSTQFLSAQDTDGMALLPESVWRNHRRVSFVTFRTDQAFHHDQRCELNSKVFGVSVEDFTGFQDGEMVEIYLSPIKTAIQRNQSRACAYWEFGSNGSGHWSQDGCTLVVSAGDQLDLCRCDHLTHFAEIIISKNVFSEIDEAILEIVSIIGCSISIVGLTIIAITAAVFRSWRKIESNRVWLQLCSAVMFLNICFLVTIFVKFDQATVSCVVIGISLQYSVLATYCWMLVISVLSYRKLVLVFVTDIRYKLLVCFIFSWGFPLLIIGILIAVDSDAYSGRFEEMTPSGLFCYPEGVALWATVYAPIGIMWFINWCLYGIIIKSTSESKDVRRHSKSKDSKISASVSCLLAFVCGIPWIFGFFAANIVAAYLFTITVTMQGFVLFLFLVVGNKKTRKLWTSLLCCGKSRGEYRSTSSGQASRSPPTSTVRRFHFDDSSTPLRDSRLYY